MAGGGLQPLDLALARSVQRLLDECMLAVSRQVAEDFLLGRIRRAYEGGVELVERHLADVAPMRLGKEGIDNSDAVAAGNVPSLFSLDAVTDDHNAHFETDCSP